MAHENGVCYSDTRYKQRTPRAVIEFLVVERECEKHSQTDVLKSIGAPLDAGCREWLQEMELHDLDATATSPRAPTIEFVRMGESQVSNWPYSFPSIVVMQWQSLTLWDIGRYAEDGLLEDSQPSTNNKGKTSVLIC